jgi:glycerol kinase
LTTIAWQIDGKTTYALEGSIFIAGAVVQWLRDGMHMIRDAAEIEAIANTVEDSGDVYLVPAFAGLGAPHWNPYGRGLIAGLTRATELGHIARAALESIAYQSTDVMQAMQADADIPFTELRVDGGASVNNTLMQIQADVMDLKVIRPKNHESTALGAAYLAGLAVGFWTLEEVKTLWKADRHFEPEMDAEIRDKKYKRWLKAVELSKNWIEE